MAEREIRFSGTQNQPKNGLKAFLHFLPYLIVFLSSASPSATLQYHQIGSAKNWPKIKKSLVRLALNSLLRAPKTRVSGTRSTTSERGTLGTRRTIILTGRHFRFEHVHGYNVDEHNPAWTV